jgi:single-stranded DNA-binding protein
MLVTISGRTGRATETKFVPRKDGSGNYPIAETTLAVKVTSEDSDWYKLKFIGDTLVKAAEYIAKGVVLSVVGEFLFETWTNDSGEACSRPVINVSEIQLPPKPTTI